MLNGSPAIMLWAAGLLAFRPKPEGGTDYTHTVVLLRGNNDQELAASVALGEAHRRYPDQDGCVNHEVTVTSMGAPPPHIEAAGPIYSELWQERQRQIQLGHDAEHDNLIPLAGWGQKIEEYAEFARRALTSGVLHVPGVPRRSAAEAELEFRRRVIETAALCVAAVEAFDRGAAT